jgi:2-C-methyl-D-erythritol 4-phosphate cytidylyltransferase
VEDSVLAAATDDASLVEAAGGTIALVEAPRENIKVTTQLDLRVAEAMLAARC